MYKVFFTFDFLSPFSYLTWKLLNRERNEMSSASFLLRPVAMPMVIKEFQPVGPAEVPVKRDYLTRECIRIAELEKIPFEAPMKLPFISTDLLRAVCALADEKEWQWKLTDFLFDKVWQERRDPEDIESLIVDFDMPSNIKELCFDRGARKQLKEYNKAAIEEKLFGVPGFSVYKDEELKEVFWGLNSMPHLKLFLRGELNFSQKTFDEFQSLFN